MKDNIKPDHYRKGNVDLYEAFSQIFPHNEYRSGMQMIAMRYMFRDKKDRVEDLNKSIYTLERLKEKEIEHANKNTKEQQEPFDDTAKDFGGVKTKITGQYLGSVYLNHEDLLRRLSYDGYLYLSRDRDGVLYASDGEPYKVEDLGFWDVQIIFDREPIQNDNFPEIKWSDDEPTRIADLPETYENGGGNENLED